MTKHLDKQYRMYHAYRGVLELMDLHKRCPYGSELAEWMGVVPEQANRYLNDLRKSKYKFPMLIPNGAERHREFAAERPNDYIESVDVQIAHEGRSGNWKRHWH